MRRQGGKRIKKFDFESTLFQRRVRLISKSDPLVDALFCHVTIGNSSLVLIITSSLVTHSN